MAKKHNTEIGKIESKLVASLQVQANQYDKLVLKWKKKLEAEQEKLKVEREKWQDKINKLDAKLEAAKNRIHNEKQKNRDLIQKHIDEVAEQEMGMNLTIQDLQEENFDMAKEWQAAMYEKRKAVKRTKRVVSESATRLAKWRAERDARREAEDKLARISKQAESQKAVLERYQTALEASDDTKKDMKKEWDDDRAAGSRGGARSWPVWVVQLICELLVNGTPPTAIPGNIKTMYETLYGEDAKEVPSVNFCRRCRIVVQVIGETMTALKLANSKTWKQVFTDATSRRQISFLVLLIGVMDEDGRIDPVVVSSCIFMEDETSETEAQCVLDKVC